MSEGRLARDLRPLNDLLLHSFSGTELRQFLMYGPTGDEVVRSLPEQGSLTELAFAAVRVLDQRNLIDDALFDRLIDERPRREAEIRAAAARALRPAPAAPVTSAPVTPLVNPPSVRNPASAVRVLHLSDFHFRASTSWDSSTVLGRLVADIRRLRSDGLHPHLAVLTGDIAYSGKPEEYSQALKWIQGELLPAAGLMASDLLVAPGNHDADRSKVKGVAALAQKGLLAEATQEGVASVLGGESSAVLLARHDAFVDFLNQLGAAGRTWDRPWGCIQREAGGARVHLAAMSSAWLSTGDQDRGNLALGLWQVNETLRGADDADVVIVALHHPWDWFTTWDAVSQNEIHRTADLVLRGHLHDARHVFSQSPAHAGLLEIAAGACYESSDHPNAYHLLEIDTGARQVRVHPRHWDAHRRDWRPDRNLFDADIGTLPLRAAKPA